MPKPTPKVIAVYARSEHGTIAVNSRLPWKLVDDFNFLRTILKGKAAVMGRQTYNHMPANMLCKCSKIIVLSTDASYKPRPKKDKSTGGQELSVTVAHTFVQAMQEAAKAGTDVIIAGGAAVYNEALTFGWCDEVIETVVEGFEEPEPGTPVTRIPMSALPHKPPMLRHSVFFEIENTIRYSGNNRSNTHSFCRRTWRKTDFAIDRWEAFHG